MPAGIAVHQTGESDLSTTERHNLRLLLQYDGTGYSGWQMQSNARTIQGVLAQVIERITCEPVALIASGRTDAGVHARGQVANFHTRRFLDPGDWKKALNRMLPEDIRVLRVDQVRSSFHARKSAVSKRYCYQVHLGEVVPPWDARYYLHRPSSLDLEKMEESAGFLLGVHDMHSFAASGCQVKGFVREIFRSEFCRHGDHLFYRIEANGFLQHMVRSIVGTLLEVGRRRFRPEDFQTILLAMDRRQAGPTAPAHALFLEQVYYRRSRSG